MYPMRMLKCNDIELSRNLRKSNYELIIYYLSEEGLL